MNINETCVKAQAALGNVMSIQGLLNYSNFKAHKTRNRPIECTQKEKTEYKNDEQIKHLISKRNTGRTKSMKTIFTSFGK